MNIINLTPHTVVIALDGNDTTITIPPALGPDGKPTPARVSTQQVPAGNVNGIPVVSTVYGDVVGLPDPKPDTIYIVSALVLGRVERPDVFAPDTGPTAIRDEKGNIVAVTRLVTNPR